MALAAERDMVAHQYANGFADVFDLGVPALLPALSVSAASSLRFNIASLSGWPRIPIR